VRSPANIIHNVTDRVFSLYPAHLPLLRATRCAGLG
jgi:hypothetical protein